MLKPDFKVACTPYGIEGIHGIGVNRVESRHCAEDFVEVICIHRGPPCFALLTLHLKRNKRDPDLYRGRFYALFQGDIRQTRSRGTALGSRAESEFDHSMKFQMMKGHQGRAHGHEGRDGGYGNGKLWLVADDE